MALVPRSHLKDVNLRECSCYCRNWVMLNSFFIFYKVTSVKEFRKSEYKKRSIVQSCL